MKSGRSAFQCVGIPGNTAALSESHASKVNCVVPVSFLQRHPCIRSDAVSVWDVPKRQRWKGNLTYVRYHLTSQLSGNKNASLKALLLNDIHSPNVWVSCTCAEFAKEPLYHPAMIIEYWAAYKQHSAGHCVQFETVGQWVLIKATFCCPDLSQQEIQPSSLAYFIQITHQTLQPN